MAAGEHQTDVNAVLDADINTVLDARVVPSTVTIGGAQRADGNGFVTALAARARRCAGLSVPDGWLDTIESCRVTEVGFTFWPVGRRPAWAPDLPADADDTSIMTLELLHAGRLTLPIARRIACLGIARHRIGEIPAPGPPWPVQGMFATWHRTSAALGGRRDLVDCTVAANTLALFAAIDVRGVPGVDETAAAVNEGLEWAAGDAARVASLSPFYPDPSELALAVEHAVDMGCTALLPALQALRDSRLERSSSGPICSSPYGLVQWHSPALQLVRELAASAGGSGQARAARPLGVP